MRWSFVFALAITLLIALTVGIQLGTLYADALFGPVR